MNRIEYCRACYDEYFFPIRREIVHCIRAGVLRASKSILSLTDSMNRFGFGHKQRYFIDEHIEKLIQYGELKGVLRIPYDGRGNVAPSYYRDIFAFDINRVRRPGRMPRRALIRENRRDLSQANLFSDEELDRSGIEICRENLDNHVYANIVYTATLTEGVTSILLGFPLNSAEGRGWILPPIDLITAAKISAVHRVDMMETKKTSLKEDVAKLRNKSAS